MRILRIRIRRDIRLGRSFRRMRHISTLMKCRILGISKMVDVRMRHVLEGSERDSFSISLFIDLTGLLRPFSRRTKGHLKRDDFS
jgi:hypothetical protein